MSIRNMIRMILNESFESDKNELAELYPDLEQQISQLGPKWIMWLSSRFGNAKKREEVHPIEDALATILAFSKKDAAMGQKYKSSEQWRAAVDAQFPERKWATPADAMTMTVDDMETLLAMSERKKQNVDASTANIDADFLAKVGPWNLYMPTTRENSCAIAGVDKLTGKPATTWCTARTSGSNLFYSYIARKEQNIILFYLIKDAASAPDDRISIGFIDGKPKIDGQHGGVTVNAQNDGMSAKSLKSVLGSFYKPIMNILSKKSLEIAGEHPAKGKIKDAAMNIAAFADILRGLSAEEATDMKMTIMTQDTISEEVAMQLARDENDYIRADVANMPSVPVEVLMQLARDKKAHVRKSVATNHNTPAKVLTILAEDEENTVREGVAANKNAPLKVLIQLASDENVHTRRNVAENPNTPAEILARFADDEDVRQSIARNSNTPASILAQLASDEDGHTRQSIARNSNTPASILAQLANDKYDHIRRNVAANHNTPIESLAQLAKDKNSDVRQRVATNKNTLPETLANLARDKVKSVKHVVALSPNLSLEVLTQLAKDEDYYVRYNIAANSSTPAKILMNLANDAKSGIRFNVARNSNTPSEILARLAGDADKHVRLNVIANPNVSTEVLLQLTKDKNVEIRTIALEKLKERNVYEAVILKILKTNRRFD